MVPTRWIHTVRVEGEADERITSSTSGGENEGKRVEKLKLNMIIEMHDARLKFLKNYKKPRSWCVKVV